MGTVPDLTTVREYLRVPATALSDADLQRMMDTAYTDQLARCTWPGLTRNAVLLTVADMTATVAVRGAEPGAVFAITWGDAAHDDVTADANGNAQAQHVYAAAGDNPASVRDATGRVLAAVVITVPADVVAVDVTYPDALAQAFLRRVQREVAARNLPLGMVGLDASEYGPERLPFYDALVEEHERAFRRVVLA